MNLMILLLLISRISAGKFTIFRGPDTIIFHMLNIVSSGLINNLEFYYFGQK